MNSVQVFQITSSPKNDSGNPFQYLRSNFSLIHFNACHQAHRLLNRAPFCSSSCSIGLCCLCTGRTFITKKNIVPWLLQNHRIVFFKIHLWIVRLASYRTVFMQPILTLFNCLKHCCFFVVLWNNIVAKNNSGSHFQYLNSNFSLIHFECKCLWHQSDRLLSHKLIVMFDSVEPYMYVEELSKI